MLALFAVLALQTQEAARAESLLAAGALREARTVAEKLVARSPNDPQAHLLLGRVWFAWPTVGRYTALQEFKTAARLAPRDPVPLYHQMEVGYYLGSDEGEVIARSAILGILAIDPGYRDTWARFQLLYHNESIWRKADRALAHHPDHPVALEHRAEVALALEEPARAESLGAAAAGHGNTGPAIWLLRAEAALLANQDAAGQALYDSAIAHADLDSAEVLWARASLIASPAEVMEYDRTPPEQRRAFFEAFWGVRDPNLLTPGNERLGEQVRRVSEARREFRLLHPRRMYYHSPTARALAWFNTKRWLFGVADSAPGAINQIANRSSAVAQAATLDYQSFQDSAADLAFSAGLDAHGLMWVRHGKPDVRALCTPDPRIASSDPTCGSVLDGDGWLYYTPEGPRSVYFRGEVFAPVSGGQLRGVRKLLRTDRSQLPAPLDARATAAFFKGRGTGHTDLYFRVSGDSSALAVWDAQNALAARAFGHGLLAVDVPAGGYRFGLDVDSAGVLGRARDTLVVPWFDPDQLKLSSLVLGDDSGATGRLEVLRAMPADLTFDAGAPLVAYTELYGLTDAGDGRTRYRARYTFAPERSLIGRVLRGTDPVSFEFDREADIRAVVTERLMLAPGRVAPGRYRVTLEVTDVARNVKSETAMIVVTIR